MVFKKQKSKSIILNFHALFLILLIFFILLSCEELTLFSFFVVFTCLSYLFCVEAILKTVEKLPCKNGTYFSLSPLAVAAALDWKGQRKH